MEISLIVSIVGGAIGALLPVLGFVLKVSSRLSEHDAKIASLERFHDSMMKRMIDATISPHTPELDKVLRKMRRGEEITKEEREFALRECEKEFWNAKKEKQFGRATALSMILAQLENPR